MPMLLYMLLVRVSGELLPALLRFVTFHRDEVLALPSFAKASQLYSLHDKNRIKLVLAKCNVRPLQS